jgi:hypothetical protein
MQLPVTLPHSPRVHVEVGGPLAKAPYQQVALCSKSKTLMIQACSAQWPALTRSFKHAEQVRALTLKQTEHQQDANMQWHNCRWLRPSKGEYDSRAVCTAGCQPSC